MITVLRFILFFLLTPVFAIVAQAAKTSHVDFCIVDARICSQSVVLDDICDEVCNYDSSGALLHQRKSIDGEDDFSEYKELETSGARLPLFSFLVEFVATNRVEGTYGTLRAAGARDGHHIIQDAAVRDLPGYNRNAAPAVQLDGPSTRIGTEHYSATQAQRRAGGGTYGAERRNSYRALREAGVSPSESRRYIEGADTYFDSIGVTRGTPTRIPGNRRSN